MSVGSTRNGGEWQYSVRANGWWTIITELSGMIYLKGTVLFPIGWRCKLMIPIGRLCTSKCICFNFYYYLGTIRANYTPSNLLIISAFISSSHPIYNPLYSKFGIVYSGLIAKIGNVRFAFCVRILKCWSLRLGGYLRLFLHLT